VIVVGLCQYEASKLITKHVFARADFPESGWENAMAGGGMGVFMGMLFGALDTPLHAETMTARQQFVHAARTMGSRSMHMAKTFAIMGAIFSGTECLIEKVLILAFVTHFLLLFFFFFEQKLLRLWTF
jgi:hypothetical protein